MTKEEMVKRIDTVNTTYLLGLSAKERKDLCTQLLNEVKQFTDLEAPKCWEDCVNNPGVYNELANKRNK